MGGTLVPLASVAHAAAASPPPPLSVGGVVAAIRGTHADMGFAKSSAPPGALGINLPGLSTSLPMGNPPGETPLVESSAPGSSPPGLSSTEAPPQLPGEENLTVDPAQLEQQAQEEAARAAIEEEQKQQNFRRNSFEKAAGGLLPLTPDEVRDFMRRVEATQKAAIPPSEGPPKGGTKVVTVELDPGAVPPQIDLAADHVTTVDVVDATGAPWPILDVGIGGNFEVTPTQAGSHVLRVVPLVRSGGGDLSLLLKNLPTPVIFRLVAGGPSYQMRYDVQIPKMGPNARTPLIKLKGKELAAGDETLTLVLQNAPPKSAERLTISGVDMRTMAWRLGNRVFVRTPLTLLSPAWNASVSSSDGTTVYDIGEAPVLLLSDNGALIRARLTKDEGQNDGQHP